MHSKSGSYGIFECYPGVSTTRKYNNSKALPNYTAYRLSRESHRSGVTNVEQRHEPVSHLPHQAKPRIACIRGAATTGIRSSTINDRARPIQNKTQLPFVPRQSHCSHISPPRCRSISASHGITSPRSSKTRSFSTMLVEVRLWGVLLTRKNACLKFIPPTECP
jgi:hypothetical protein